jgi:hypothetical protein
MNRTSRLALSILLSAAPILHADVTLRYKSDVQLAPFLPAETLDQFNKAMKSGMAANSQTIRMKNGKALSTTGSFSCIVDFEKHELTFIDGESKHLATVSADKFNESWVASMPQIPEQARKVFDSMKFNFDSRKTGRTEAIQGVQAEEREAVLSMEMPVPGGEEGGPPIVMMKVVIQLWTAKPEEALRVQAVRELTAYNLWTTHFMNPGQAMEKIFTLMPGFGDGMTKMFAELAQNKTVMLRTQMKIYSTMLGQMAQSMQKRGEPLPAGYDPDLPLIQVSQDVEELSTAVLEDALFTIPEGYAMKPLPDMIQRLTRPNMIPAAESKPESK